ncbi:lipopolysaccharide transport system permease protein [Oryzisolibacter propanilivorax]|uniref:Transport permease protein n=1 Tax=Oryzisolibacter propanilivorax TaxID=1527607 RepID=A0A1G9S4E3_9BURK|nr:ABC transporter permease [Oryzisolibacter propanilivorax]SDM30346.1 lipopolysaccharide transport system permease protein [Oryzisolibacter propanilivorax]
MSFSFLIEFLCPWRQRALVAQLARREVHARYRQSALGLAWVVITPLLMLGVYTLVFRHVMRVRWQGMDESNLAFALRIYAGLAVFSFFAECVNRAPGLVLEQPSLVKKVVFPTELLAWVSAASAGVGLAVSGVLLLVLTALVQGSLPVTALALPLAWLPLVPLVLGLGWLLAGVGTYVRDVGQVLGMAMSALMFLSPIFYPVEALPEAVRGWMVLNPIAGVITDTRAVLAGQWPAWGRLALTLAAHSLLALAGALFFRRVRVGFADVV